MDIEAIWVSVELAAFTTLILFLFGLPFAYWLAVTRWRLKFLLESLVVLPMILPPTVLGFYILVAIGPRLRTDDGTCPCFLVPRSPFRVDPL